ncbi:MAG: nucleotidyltransferase domain-containing protein [Thermoleophilia bacterium]|nr:nucleotidyltransferase domain-containing protein [Thermoleophilia bacterium]
MFSVEERDRVRRHVLDLAASDARVVAAAAVGGSAGGERDRWSDIDLTFGVADGVALDGVLGDWTREVESELDGIHLFDLPRQASIYRVFLLPGCLQVDLSFTPASEFGAYTPRFELLFGEAVAKPQLSEPSAHERLGLGVHHAVRARFCLERGRLWQAEYWITSMRDEALALACRRHGLETLYGRGRDRLPPDVLAPFEDALVRSVDAAELQRALTVGVDCLLREADEARSLANRVEPRLRELVA